MRLRQGAPLGELTALHRPPIVGFGEGGKAKGEWKGL